MVYSHSILFPEGNLGDADSINCYVKLKKNSPLGFISKSIYKLDNETIKSLALDSMEARINSLKCLKEIWKKDSNQLVPSYEKQVLVENHFLNLEWKILLETSRNFPLTPTEYDSAKQWFETQAKIREEIHNLTIGYLTETDTNPSKFSYQELFLSYYGSLIREREKFLFSLSIETYNSYIDSLKKRQEKQ